VSEWAGVKAWALRIIEGVGGMNDYDRYEVVVWNVPERIAAAEWVIRCLANPQCEGSEEVLQAIMAQREANK
jgi:hypothetical protein